MVDEIFKQWVEGQSAWQNGPVVHSCRAARLHIRLTSFRQSAKQHISAHMEACIFLSSSFSSLASFWLGRTVTIRVPLILQGRLSKFSCVPRSLSAFPSALSYAGPKSLNWFFGHVSPSLVCRKTIIWAFMFKLYHCYCQTLDSALISQWWEFSVPNNPVHKFYFNSNGLLSTWCAFYHRYEQPKCDGNARAHPTKPKDHYRSRHLQGASLKLHRFHLVESAVPVQQCRAPQSCNSKAEVLVSASAFADIISGAAQRNAW